MTYLLGWLASIPLGALVLWVIIRIANKDEQRRIIRREADAEYVARAMDRRKG